MREIKFRAYYKYEDKSQLNGMYYFGLDDFDSDDGSQWIDADKGYLSYSDMKKCPIMQYTGLKDKNGKEIYEGDLFKQTYKIGYSIYEVCFGEYDNGLAYEDNVSGNGWYLKEHRHWPEYELEIVDFNNENEVIGNIHENPELLSLPAK